MELSYLRAGKHARNLLHHFCLHGKKWGRESMSCPNQEGQSVGKPQQESRLSLPHARLFASHNVSRMPLDFTFQKQIISWSLESRGFSDFSGARS